MEALKDKMKQKIYSEGNVAFSELTDLEGTEGEYDFILQDYNLILWRGLSHACIQALSELLNERSIHFEPCEHMVYLYAGKVLNMELAKTPGHKYKKPRWLPTVLKPHGFSKEVSVECFW